MDGYTDFIENLQDVITQARGTFIKRSVMETMTVGDLSECIIPNSIYAIYDAHREEDKTDKPIDKNLTASQAQLKIDILSQVDEFVRERIRIHEEAYFSPDRVEIKESIIVQLMKVKDFIKKL